MKKLIKGKAEIFGNEMPVKKIFTLKSCKIAIFSWQGAEIQVRIQVIVKITIL